MKLEEQQELKLHQNWEVRQISAAKVATWNGYDFYDWQGVEGYRCFYAVRDTTPVGYVFCHQAPDRVIIASSYITGIARRQGLGTVMYKIIVQVTGKLESDFELSDGARALWNRLSHDPDIHVKPNGSGFVACKRN